MVSAFCEVGVGCLIKPISDVRIDFVPYRSPGTLHMDSGYYSVLTSRRCPSLNGGNMSQDFSFPEYSARTKLQIWKYSGVRGLALALVIIGLLLSLGRSLATGEGVLSARWNIALNNVQLLLINVGLTILIIDIWYKYEQKKRETRRLIRQIIDPCHDLVYQAIDELRERKWLSDGSLRNSNFAGLNAEQMDFHGACLDFSYWAGTKLSKSSFAQASLAGANFEGSNLALASFYRANLREADLRHASLWQADLGGACLKDAKFDGANLFEANLERADLSGTSFIGTDMRKTNLRRVLQLTDRQLRQTKMLVHAIMSDGTCYDGRYNLPEDIAYARRLGIDVASPQALAAWYGVSSDEYLRGQEWADQTFNF